MRWHLFLSTSFLTQLIVYAFLLRMCEIEWTLLYRKKGSLAVPQVEPWKVL